MNRTYLIEQTNGVDAVDFLLGTKKDARAVTFKYISDISEQELQWRPYENWNSVADLLWHIAAVDYCFTVFFIENRELNGDEKEKWEMAFHLDNNKHKLKNLTASELTAMLEQTHRFSNNAIAQLDAAKLFKKRWDDYDKINGSNLAWILYHAVEDEVHHRGQISLLRKLYKADCERTD
jgi:uncharacterized damage-inducible protein DinB